MFTTNDDGERKKFYRAVKDSFLWKEGAVLELDEDEEAYLPIDGLNVWDMTPYNEEEQISRGIVEASTWFEEVYEVSDSEDEKPKFANAEEIKQKYQYQFKKF